MGLKDELRRIRRQVGLDRRPSCRECGGRIIYVEHYEDGAVTYPLGEPCKVCESARRIEVFLGARDGA
jgi:hypothetical protein